MFVYQAMKVLQKKAAMILNVYVLHSYILIYIMSVNVKVYFYIMIDYIVLALPEAIFPEVKSIARVNGCLSIL